MKITEALFAEHLVFHNMFDHVEAAAPKLKSLAEVKTLASLVQTLLQAHSEIEDELFIEPLEHCFEQIGHCQTFHQEHALIERSLKLIQHTKQVKQARALLLGVVVASRKHFDKEERIVFPMAEKILSANTLMALGLSWREQRQIPTGSS